MKNIFLLLPSFLFFSEVFAQCNVTASASQTTINCGQTVQLSAYGQSSGTVMLNENFNSGNFGPGWSSTPGSVNFNNPCSPSGVDGTTHAWMDNNTSVPRILTSSPYNLSGATAGVTICFDLLFAEQGDAAPCEGPDEPDEGVYLQYSTDGGATWVDIHYFDPNGGNDPQLTNWNNWCFSVPAAAITSNTMFQWLQTADSGADYDHWGIDNVQIYQNDVNMELVWLHDNYSYGIGSSGGVNPNVVAPVTTTTYTAQLTTGSGSTCTETVTVIVNPPVYDIAISSTPDTLCPGDCANVTATAQQIISPHTTPTFENNEFSLVTGGSASVNINVQGLNTTSIANGTITQVVINGFNFSGNFICSNFGGCPCNGSTVSFGQTCNLNTSGFAVTLTAPGGCEIELVPAGVATGNYNNTVFVPVGGAAFGGTFPNGGTWAPGEPMSDLNGCNPNGVWTLSFTGPALGFGFGTLTGWSISFDDPAITAPVTYTWSPTNDMTGSTTLTPTICPTGIGTTNYSLTVQSTTNPACPQQTEDIPIIMSPCNGCIPPAVTITQPVPQCAPAIFDLATAVSGTGSNIVTFHANSNDANQGVSDLTNTVVSSGGVYYVRVEDATDPLCFTVQSINVTITSPIVVTVSPASPAICSGDSVSISASGAGTFTWANSIGLSSSTGSSVNASPSSTTTYTITGTTGSCTGDTTITVTVNANPTVSVTPGSTTICPGSSVNLTAFGATNYTWSPGTDLSSTTSASVTATPSSTITYTITGETNGCTNDTTITLTVSSFTNTAIAGPASICSDGQANLSVNNGSSWSWSPASGLSCTNCQNPIATPTSNTEYTVTVTSGACTATATHSVTVNNVPLVSVSPVTICQGTTGQLSANGANTWEWIPSTGLSCSTCANPNVTITTTNTYSVVGIDANGCDDTTSVVVTVNALPVISVVQGNATICPGGSATMQINADAGSTFNWAPSTGLNTTSDDSVIVTLNTLGTTQYSVTATLNGCSSQQTIDITVSNTFNVTANSVTYCSGDSAQFFATGGDTWNWTPATGLSCTSCQNPYVSATNTTTYSVSASQGTCNSATTALATVNASPAAGFNYTPGNNGLPQSVVFNNTSLNSNTYQWNFGDGTTSTNPDPTHIYTEEGEYTVMLIANNMNGCSADTVYYTVIIFDGSSIIVPNVFTPNGDNINELFEITTKGIKELNCIIFDRWGLKTAEISGANNPAWDGRTSSGNSASEGTYYYIINATGIDDKAHELHGNLLLIK